MHDVPLLVAGLVVSEAASSRGDRARFAAEAIRRSRGYRWVGIYDVSPTEISAIAWTEPGPPAFPVFPVEKGLSGCAVSTRAPVVVQDVRADPRYLETFGNTHAEAIFPILDAEDRVVGTLDVESETADAFTPDDVAMLEACATALRPLWHGSARRSECGSA